MSQEASSAQEGATETKTVQVAGFTEAMRKKELERISSKMAAAGWTLQAYHDEGMSKSSATFSRPLVTAGVSAPKGKKKVWRYVIAAIIVLGAIGALSGGGNKSKEPSGSGKAASSSGDGKSAPSSASAPAARLPDLLTKDLAAYTKAGKSDRLAAIRAYASANAISSGQDDSLYNYLSEASHTKSQGLKVADVLGWAKTEMDANGGKLRRAYYNLDNVTSQFSPWDGSHRKLEAIIKKSMNDEKSYDHIETRYRIVLEGKGAPYVFLTTQFSGKNAFGGTVKNSISARASIVDGTILEVIQ